VVRGSTNLSRDDEGATQDRSNAPITTTHDPEQVGSAPPPSPPPVVRIRGWLSPGDPDDFCASRISNPGSNNDKKEGGNFFGVLPTFLEAKNFTVFKIIFFWTDKKIFSQLTKSVGKYFYPQNCC
jgi:hypothetical protein